MHNYDYIPAELEQTNITMPTSRKQCVYDYIPAEQATNIKHQTSRFALCVEGRMIARLREGESLAGTHVACAGPPPHLAIAHAWRREKEAIYIDVLHVQDKNVWP